MTDSFFEHLIHHARYDNPAGLLVPGVNTLAKCGRAAVAGFADVWQMQDDFVHKVEAEFERMIDGVVGEAVQ